MMMERAKTAPAPEPTATAYSKAGAPPTTADPSSKASAEERVQDLERRLNLLGGESSPAATPTVNPPAAAAPVKPQTGKNNPLLKRIQAAQERARQAEQKEREAKAAAAAEEERAMREEEEARRLEAERQRIEKAQSALRSVAGRALEDKQKEILAQLEGRTAAPGAVAEEAATPAVPIMKSLDPPPPSFDSMKFPPPRMQQPHEGPGSREMVGHGMNSRMLMEQQQPPHQQQAPPSFDFVEKQIMSSPVAENVPLPPPPVPTAPIMSPSAPPITMTDADHLSGIQPVAPPFALEQQQPDQAGLPPPPSFAQFEQQQSVPNTAQNNEASSAEDEGVFDYDLDGNPLSLEQRQALLDEQRLLYENIMKEKAANDAAIARANADAFDLRSSSAAARAMDGGAANAHVGSNNLMDSAGRDAEVSGEGETEEDRDDVSHRESRRMVKIGNNQMVALHGQDRTKKAIKEGTAILVQCINCQNWMQVTDTATLMFCPVCQVVSPVIQQNEVLTKEEAIQLTMDRKLAEKLQAEAYADGDEEKEGEENTDVWSNERGFFANMFGGGSEATTAPSSPHTTSAATSGTQSDSWWGKISSIVSYGVAEEPRQRGDMGVTLPPGAPPTSKYPAERRGKPTTAVNTMNSGSPAQCEETQGLLTPVVVDGNEHNLPAGRVAESKPLFSCIADGVSNAASAMFSNTGERDAEGNVYGVDSSSLLITGAGRGVGEGTGDYAKLPDQD